MSATETELDLPDLTTPMPPEKRHIVCVLSPREALCGANVSGQHRCSKDDDCNCRDCEACDVVDHETLDSPRCPITYELCPDACYGE